MNRTLVVVKPHAMELHKDIIADLEAAIGKRAVKVKAVEISSTTLEMWKELYNVKRKEDTSWWQDFFQVGFANKPAFCLVFEGPNVVQIVKEIIGLSRDPLENEANTIRYKYATRLMEEGKGIITLSDGKKIEGNVIHATDTKEGEFEREYDIFKPYFS